MNKTMGYVMQQRIAYIDILKGFAIMAVVWFHIKCTLPSYSWFKPSILGSLWHVPLFFFISGFFITEKKLSATRAFVKSKVKGLYIKGLYYFLPMSFLHNTFLVCDWYRSDVSYSGVYETTLSLADIFILIVKQFFLMSREPIVGAMWFLDSLFIAMIGLAILYWVSRNVTNIDRSGYLFPLSILTLVIASNMATEVYDVVLPKINNSVTAMGLIYLGSFMYQSGYLQNVNKFSFIAGILVLWCLSLTEGSIALNNNRYTSIVQLIGVTISSFYVFAYIAKKIATNLVGRLCTFIGEYSFTIMGLHFVGFKICSMILSFATGTEFETYYLTTPDLGSGYHYIVIYFAFGVLIPIIIARAIELMVSKIKIKR